MSDLSGEPDFKVSERLMQRFWLSDEEAARLTPQERLDRFYALQQEWADELMADPVAYDAWFRHNVKKRAIDWQPPEESAE